MPRGRKKTVLGVTPKYSVRVTKEIFDKMNDEILSTGCKKKTKYFQDIIEDYIEWIHYGDQDIYCVDNKLKTKIDDLLQLKLTEDVPYVLSFRLTHSIEAMITKHILNNDLNADKKPIVRAIILGYLMQL